ncbi:hypothetical protein FACS1894199_06570 [Bacteroidia bacterium]|nr:hypothetical protein FACS1894199_06570 [Bacteroidia bacterium]
MNIFVAKLSSLTRGKDLAALFEEYGTVNSAKVIFDRETGNSKCYGFVEMLNESEGVDAINALHESEFQGKPIIVKVAHRGENGAEQTHIQGIEEKERSEQPEEQPE